MTIHKQIEQIIVVKETREGEGRVALTPTSVADLKERFPQILIESNAGLLAGFSDEDYVNAGASIFTVHETPFPPKSILLRVKRPTKQREALENKLIPSGTIMMGFLDPFDVSEENHFANWRSNGIWPIL